jgi:hypothetical protein
MVADMAKMYDRLIEARKPRTAPGAQRQALVKG